jgi:hypothetical protein
VELLKILARLLKSLFVHRPESVVRATPQASVVPDERLEAPVEEQPAEGQPKVQEQPAEERPEPRAEAHPRKRKKKKSKKRSKMYSIAIDPGYGGFKAAFVDGQNLEVAVVPSVVGVGDTNLGALSLGELGKRGRAAVPQRVEFGGVSYLVGDNIDDYTTPRQRMDAERLTDTPDLRALFYTTMGNLLGEGSYEASIIAGFPVHVLEDKAQAGRVLRGLRKWMVGEHTFTAGNAETRLTVNRVEGMPQPAGAFFAWGLNHEGRWIQDDKYQDAPVAICDIGFNTLDLFNVRAGRVIRRYTGGDTAGMRRAAETLIERVQGMGGGTLSLSQADMLLRERSPTLWIDGEATDLQPLVQQAVEVAASGIAAFIERKWGNAGGFALLLFTGGGMIPLQRAVLQLYPRGIVLDDPVTANAVGLAKYATRVFKAD